MPGGGEADGAVAAGRSATRPALPAAPSRRRRLQLIESRNLHHFRGKDHGVAWVSTMRAPVYTDAASPLQARGLLCKETHETVIRVAPPLTVTREEVDWAVEQISEVLTTL